MNNKIHTIIGLIALTLIGIGCSESGQRQANERTKSAPKTVKLDSEEDIVFNEGEGEASQIRNFYFLFDGSGSMKKECSGQRKIDGAQQAVLKFLEKVPSDVNLGLAIFGTTNNAGVKEVVPIGPDNRDAFKKEILKTLPGTATPLGKATQLAVDKLIEQYKKQLGYGEYRLIIVTDGLASNPDLFRRSLGRSTRYSFISVYGIGLCIDGNHVLKQHSISYTDAYNYEELESALTETLAELPDFDITDFNPEDYVVE